MKKNNFIQSKKKTNNSEKVSRRTVQQKSANKVITVKLEESSPTKTCKTNLWKLKADSNLEFAELNFDFEGKYKVLKAGTGKAPLTKFRVKKLIHKAAAVLREQEANLVECDFAQKTKCSEDFVLISLLEANYVYDNYKSKKDKKINLGQLMKKAKDLKEIKIISENIELAKNIINAPANEVSPETLANKVKTLFKSTRNVEVKILDEKACQKLRMGSFLAVGQASPNKPRLIEINYSPTKSHKPHFGLIGKGITFDTGGLCLKPNNYMYGMHSDMAGAATVIATIKAAAEMKIKTPVTALVLACENAFDENAYRPGDVLTAMNGKTIEVVDTDAEGRLTLADAISYLSGKKEIDLIIDYATLTGSCASALGHVASGAFTNNEVLLKKYQKCAEETGEPIWELPMFEEFKESLKSDIADILQCDGRPDASMAAIFLKEFLVRELPWLHLDIAGTAFLDEPNEYFSRGATGRQVWSTIQFLKEY